MGIMNILESAKRLSFVADALARVGITAEHIETAHAAGNTDFVAASVAGVDAVKAASDGLAQAQEKLKAAEALAAENVTKLSALQSLVSTHISADALTGSEAFAAAIEAKIGESAAKLSAEKVAGMGFKPQPGASSDAPPNEGESANGNSFTEQRAAQLKAQYPDLGKR